jgi:ABC-type amino acid transport system permease subunit
VPGDLSKPGTSTLVERLNRISTLAVLLGTIFGGMFVLDWLSQLPVTDGIFEFAVEPWVMSPLAMLLFLAVFYVALHTSLRVENDDAGWPTIRRVYRQITG